MSLMHSFYFEYSFSFLYAYLNSTHFSGPHAGCMSQDPISKAKSQSNLNRENPI